MGPGEAAALGETAAHRPTTEAADPKTGGTKTGGTKTGGTEPADTEPADSQSADSQSADSSAPPIVVGIGSGGLTEGAADRLASLTAHAAGAPTGLIHLLDGGQMNLIGGSGLPAEWHRIQQVPGSATLAGMVMHFGFPVVVTDLANDPRVPPTAPALAVGARAYAGFPIRQPDGRIVGTCAVLDYQPRSWTPQQLSAVDEGAQACTAFVDERSSRAAADQQRRFLDALLDSLDAGVAACGADGRLVLVNRSLAATLGGADSVEVPTEEWARAFHVQHADGREFSTDELPLVRAMRGERVRGLEHAMHRGDGRTRLYVVNADPIVDAAGQRMGAVAAVHDITVARRTERFRTCELAVSTVLAEAESVHHAGPAVLEAIASTLGWPCAELWLTDADTGMLHHTAHHYAAGLRYPPGPTRLNRGQGLAGRAWHAGHPVWQSASNDAGQLAGAAPTGLRTAVGIPITSGTAVLGVLTLFAATVEDPRDSLLALLSGICAHIGQYLERRRAEDSQLALARSKQDYLGLVGHELRSPLTSITVYTDMVMGTDPETALADVMPLLEVVQRNSARLRRLVEALLDLSSLDAGHGLQPAPVDLAAITAAAVADLRPTADRRGLAVVDRLPERLRANGDPQRLRQLVSILLDNAATYTPRGGHVTVSLDERDDVAELRVSDTGPGIPVGERRYVFDRFYRGALTQERAIAGAGLGLAIATIIARRHHAQLMFDPEPPDTGAAFLLRLPLRATTLV